MNILKETLFQVFIDGKQLGNLERWHQTPLIIYSKLGGGDRSGKI